ncbi:NADH-quinone oxidoreductase subunit N [Pseudonocardia kunmingensis]|uniref:NADH-quinone oxidoreductase subunit N n=1 Tax=Pseudonocardia kunmingensis TaxID=630975 RepID=A0A543DKT0_9PSEU|nr:NADH-quinone oxidoreductase subunit N [Pseudonocardia kunmingensis]
MTGMNENPGALVPELLLLGAAVFGLLLGAWLPRHRQWLVRALAAAAALAGLAATAAAATRPDEVVFGTSYAVDTLTHATRAIVLVAVLVALALSVDATAGHRRETEFVVLLQLGALGTVLLGGANDLLLLFAAFLLASIPFYALAGWDKRALSTEAAMKYYLSGAFLGVAMLTGTAILYGVGRSTAYGPLREGLTTAPVAAAGVGLVAVLAGLLFKIGAVPGHFWVPDVTDGTPPAVAAIVTTIPKIGGLVAAYRLLLVAIPADALDWPLLVAVLAAVSMTLGNLAAFFQTTVQRLLAYSTISQVGYLLMVVAVAGRAELAQPALLFYLAGYAVTNLGAFAVVAELPRARALDDYRGMAGRRPALAAALVVCLLGLIGTPPTAVFLGKLTVFTAAIDGGFAWLAVLAVVNTVASVFYYLRWVAPAFRTAQDQASPAALQPAGAWPAGTAYVCAAAAVLLGIAGGSILPLLSGGAAS